jgi:hypothetical protein
MSDFPRPKHFSTSPAAPVAILKQRAAHCATHLPEST